MEIKKTYKADLEHIRTKAFLMGLLVAVVGFVAVLELSFSEGDDVFDSDFLDEIAEDMEYMPSIEENLPSPETVAPVSDQVKVVEEVDNSSENEETTEIVKPEVVTETEVVEETTEEKVEEQPEETYEDAYDETDGTSEEDYAEETKLDFGPAAGSAAVAIAGA